MSSASSPSTIAASIVSLRTNGWQRHYGDHRRSLVEIINNLAAAVACGKLHILDETELLRETRAGAALLRFTIDDSASLTMAREAVDVILSDTTLDDLLRQRTILLPLGGHDQHAAPGGGAGSMTLRRLDDRLRMVVADEGPGMNFLNSMKPPTKGQASMGYGFKIVLDYLDAVGCAPARRVPR